MKITKKIAIVALILVLNSCATVVTFPISRVVPAAIITANKKENKQNNCTLEITAKNLANANRLTPPENNYSVWIVSTAYGVKNVGQINVTNEKEILFQTVTPFNFDEVFITAESAGDLQYPHGVEITRIKF